MNEDQATKLRTPFPPELVGKLPRVWCKNCREAAGKVCAEHRKAKCEECGNNITTAHLHLDYVGHAAVTDRLLQADPEWTWEPMAANSDGFPVFDSQGGLWIRLTVGGVTRPGYGDPGKIGPKEAIGDALRNAAMRFGVGLDLWSKEDLSGDQHDPPAETPPEPTLDPNLKRQLQLAYRGLESLVGKKVADDFTLGCLVEHEAADFSALTDAQAKIVFAKLEEQRLHMAEGANV